MKKFDEAVSNYIKIEDNEVVREYFEKFRDKMGPKTSEQTAISWAKGAKLKKKDEEELIFQIKRYLKDPMWWGATLGKLKK